MPLNPNKSKEPLFPPWVTTSPYEAKRISSILFLIGDSSHIMTNLPCF